MLRWGFSLSRNSACRPVACSTSKYGMRGMVLPLRTEPELHPAAAQYWVEQPRPKAGQHDRLLQHDQRDAGIARIGDRLVRDRPRPDREVADAVVACAVGVAALQHDRVLLGDMAMDRQATARLQL